MVIDRRSDTLTHPTRDMRHAMWNAEVGDDCYGEDRTVTLLKRRCANLFAQDEAVFMPSGTMSNQIALRASTQPGDEVILHPNYPIAFFESAQTADLAKVVLNPHYTTNGLLTVVDIQEALEAKPRGSSYAKPTLIAMENTINAYSGMIFPYANLKTIRAFSHEHHLRVHVDGARLFNAMIATYLSSQAYGSVADSLTVCFSKGLGAPTGSILMGDRVFAERAKTFRKWYGGALHQSGIFAAAALYALDHHVDRLAEDHDQAKILATKIQNIPGLDLPYGLPATNIVMFDTQKLGLPATAFVEESKKQGILLFPWSKSVVRAVTHLGIGRQDVDVAADVLSRVGRQFGTRQVLAT
ncbi:low specificity L-threonine aldolase [Sulfobacillus sp. hq2]|uniref:threonine aldolase family protein n=1 Tax=Sulfobacillus TaxID=28033 RepID=UPI000CD112D6|nr:GntG family PLP-dependent aldolase [Sulfobacillus sp. hq2]POB11399.1 threonine aldolase [Sulfobacillus sp. hq2]